MVLPAMICPRHRIKIFKHHHLACREYLGLASNEDLAGCSIEDNVAELKWRPNQVTRSTQQCLYARDQFLEIKGLFEVVVGTASQCLDTMSHAAPRGEDEHGCAIFALT